jgi:hypothetical protein
MTRTLLDRQSELPRALPLFRYAPERVSFSLRDWDPALVRSAKDLPQYLVLGHLDPSSFRQSATGWSARWQGTEEHTHFDVAYKAEAGRWEIRQTWCGLDGGFCVYPTRMPLDKVIAQALYIQFPRNWDSAAKSRLESEYQITYVEQPENAYTFCGIPDGAFRTIVFPVAVRNLRPVRQWIQEIVEESPLTYPITVEVKLIVQALNYLEGKAPDWATQEAVVFNQSVIETGLAPHGFPVREVANDGSAAWTLRREIYFLFIGLPFAGLTDFLGRMVTDNGPIRAVSDPDLRFELRPVAIPAAFEMQTESMALWDQPRTTRSFLQFARPGEAKTVPTVEQVIEAERNAQATLAKVEAISGDVVAAIEQIFQRVTKGDAS